MDARANHWTVGQLVSVEARTWAGINQPGGIARIVQVHNDTSVAVKYVVDGRQESSVQLEYLQPHTFGHARGLRNRGLLLGRCERCGSLRTDCGSCDLQWRRSVQQKPSNRLTNDGGDPRREDSSDSSSSSSIDLDRLVAEHKRAFRRFKKRQAKSRAIVFNAPPKRKAFNDGVLADATSTTTTPTINIEEINAYTQQEDEDSAKEDLVGMVATQDVGDCDDSSMDSSTIIESLDPAAKEHNDDTMMEDGISMEYRMDDEDDDDDDDENDTFVQPEGSAERLPKDVLDQTTAIAKQDLPEFIATTLLRIETAIEETYRPKIIELEQAGKDEWQHLHTRVIQNLIRNGLDQCRLAMRRVRVPPIVEFRYDAVSDAVEELIARLRSKSLLSEDDTDLSSVESMEAWAEEAASPSSRASREEERVLPYREKGPLDSHPFALRSKQEAGEKSARRRKRQVRRKCVSKKSTKPPVRRGVSQSSAQGSPIQQHGSDDSIEVMPFVHDDASIAELAPPPKQYMSPVRMQANSGDEEAQRNAKESSRIHSRRHIRPRKQRKKGSDSQGTQVPRHRRQLREPAVDKMERWIQCNTEPIELGEEETAARLRDELFLELDSKNHLHRRDTVATTKAARSRASSCHALINRKRMEFRQETQMVEDSLVVTGKCSSLSSVLEAIECDGCRTLQDHVSSNSSGLLTFISLLRTALQLMKKPCDFDESTESIRLRKIFMDTSGSVFLEAVALQATDTTMSLFKPQAWALENVNSRQILQQLETLWADLALHAQPVELFARCVLKTQNIQDWILVRGGDHVYISSVNPDDWRAMLSTGKALTVPKVCRIDGFKKILPRCEVDCLWGIMALLSKSAIRADSEDSQSNRWELVSALFSRSSLIGDENHACPPSAGQLRSALKDLRSFSILLVDRSLGNLPKRDKLLVSLVEKTITLEAEYLDREKAPCWQESVGTITSIRDVWLSGPQNDWPTSEVSFRETIANLCGDDVPCFLNAPLLLPSSPLIRVCLGLIACWRTHLPLNKPKRTLFFVKAVKMLIQAISVCHGNNDKDKENQDIRGDSFLDAFSAQAQSTKDIGVSILHYWEARAFVSIFAFLPMRTDDDNVGPSSLLDGDVGPSNPLNDIWKMCAGEQLLTGPSFRSVNPEKLELAAKLASFLVVSLLEKNKTAAHDPRMTRAAFLFRPLRLNDEQNVSMLSKFLGYLLACINSVCKPEIEVAAAARVTARVTLALSCLWKQYQRLGHTRFSSARSRLGLAELPLAAAGQLIRKIIQLPTVGPDEEACLRITCSLVLVLSSLMALSYAGPDSSSDSDKDSTTSMRGSADAEEASDLVALLCACLRLSTPSKRFNFAIQGESEEAVALSAAGKELISRTIKDVVTCIAEIVISSKLSVPPMLIAWMSEQGPRNSSSLDGDNDYQYKRRVSCHFARMICVLAKKASLPNAAVGDHRSSLVSCFLHSLMDVKVLQNVPSINITKIGSRSGGAAEEKAFSEFLDFSKHPNKWLRRYLLEIRTYSKDLSDYLKRNGDTDFSPIFDTFGRLSPSAGLPHSLELELSDRIRFLCTLLHQAFFKDTVLDPNGLGCQILGGMCWSLVFVLEKLEILDKSLSDIGGDNYRRSKLLETLATLVEAFVGVFASMCRICCCPGLPNESSLSNALLHVCNYLILPICQEKPANLKRCLQRTIELSFSTMREESKQAKCLASNNSNKSFEQFFRVSIIRRSKELFVGLSGSSMLMRSNLLASIVAVANAGNAKKICVGFSSVEREVRSESGASPLQRSVDRILREIEQAYPLPHFKIGAFRNLRQTVIESHLLPVLNSKNPQKYLEFLVRLLDSCVDRPILKSRTLCGILRTLAMIAQTAAQEGSGQLACTVVQGVLCLAKLPAACVDTRATGWLLDWARSGANSDAEYFWLAFQFHDAFYRKLQSMPSNEALPLHVPELWSISLVEGHLDGTIVDRLQDLDRELHGVRAQVNNLYRKQLSKSCVPVSTCQSDAFKHLRQQVTELCKET